MRSITSSLLSSSENIIFPPRSKALTLHGHFCGIFLLIFKMRDNLQFNLKFYEKVLCIWNLYYDNNRADYYNRSSQDFFLVIRAVLRIFFVLLFLRDHRDFRRPKLSFFLSVAQTDFGGHFCVRITTPPRLHHVCPKSFLCILNLTILTPSSSFRFFRFFQMQFFFLFITVVLSSRTNLIYFKILPEFI